MYSNCPIIISHILNTNILDYIKGIEYEIYSLYN